MNRNALDLKAAIVAYAVFRLKHVLVAVEPCFSSHDVWSMTKSRRQYEWEIKRSMSDLRAELNKEKHRCGYLASPETSWRIEAQPNHFYIVVPSELKEKALRWIEKHLTYAGLVIIAGGHCEVVRDAPLLHRERASIERCARVARWMAVSLADLMGMVSEKHTPASPPQL